MARASFCEGLLSYQTTLFMYNINLSWVLKGLGSVGEVTLMALMAAFVTDIILARDIGGFMSIMENNFKEMQEND